MKKTGWILLGCLLCLAGCSLFGPRRADPPTAAVTTDFSAWEDIMEELVRIYTEGPATDISLILSDRFVFEGDSLDSAAVRAGRRTWDPSAEKQITSRMLADSSSWLSADNSAETKPLAVFSDSVAVRWDYALVRRDSVRIEGIAEFIITRLENRFYLVRWQDRVNPSSTGAESWGRWKMEND